MYNDFLKLLKPHFTIILPNGKPLMESHFDEIVETLNVDKVGLLSHSSFDYRILEKSNVEGAICIDPVSLPSSFSFTNVSPQHISPHCKTMIIKTNKSQESNIPFIPYGFNLEVESKDLVEYPMIGHVDLLDDMWANVGK